MAELAERAAGGDRAALAELSEVDSIDGRSVDVAAALAGASEAELEARLSELAAISGAAAEARDADEARERASALVRQDEPPEAVVEAAGSEGSGPLPLGLALGLAALAIVVGVILAVAASRRSVAFDDSEPPSGEQRRRRRREDLEAEAEQAERCGDYALAVRLRFRAGLAALEALGALARRPSLTATGAARELESVEMARLAERYQRIVFGREPASGGDASEARSGWRAVLDEVRRRG